MHRVARRGTARIVPKHGFWPVPSYGLREAHSPNLVEEAEFSELPLCRVLGRSLPARNSQATPRQAIWEMRLVHGSCYRDGVVQRSGADESRSIVKERQIMFPF
jgi:hypothetical protein